MWFSSKKYQQKIAKWTENSLWTNSEAHRFQLLLFPIIFSSFVPRYLNLTIFVILILSRGDFFRHIEWLFSLKFNRLWFLKCYFSQFYLKTLFRSQKRDQNSINKLFIVITNIPGRKTVQKYQPGRNCEPTNKSGQPGRIYGTSKRTARWKKKISRNYIHHVTFWEQPSRVNEMKLRLKNVDGNYDIRLTVFTLWQIPVNPFWNHST